MRAGSTPDPALVIRRAVSAGVAGEEVPDALARVEVAVGLADGGDGLILPAAGPGVASAFDGVENDFAAGGAISVGVVMNPGAVGGAIRIVGAGRVALAAVQSGPAAHG